MYSLGIEKANLGKVRVVNSERSINVVYLRPLMFRRWSYLTRGSDGANVSI